MSATGRTGQPAANLARKLACYDEHQQAAPPHSAPLQLACAFSCDHMPGFSTRTTRRTFQPSAAGVEDGRGSRLRCTYSAAHLVCMRTSPVAQLPGPVTRRAQLSTEQQ